ncbi:MAG: helix-turn-helix transcriptional regulator [Oscillospiraceae bacterium]|nr:helix-turn-helix transcriptional regulator [Oscillospiraceae bacterium]
MKIGAILRELRESVHLSQAKIAALCGTNQTTIAKYESEQSFPPPKIMLWYADYFDVSLDYIYGRCENPEGKLYKHQPKIAESSEEMKRFVEMCFDPKSPMNDKLKQTLFKMLEEGNK